MKKIIKYKMEMIKFIRQNIDIDLLEAKNIADSFFERMQYEMTRCRLEKELPQPKPDKGESEFCGCSYYPEEVSELKVVGKSICPKCGMPFGPTPKGEEVEELPDRDVMNNNYWRATENIFLKLNELIKVVNKLVSNER